MIGSFHIAARLITRNQLKLQGPLKANITLKASNTGKASFAWRMQEEKDFLPENTAGFEVTKLEFKNTQGNVVLVLKP